jgi:hypothetical protein
MAEGAVVAARVRTGSLTALPNPRGAASVGVGPGHQKSLPSGLDLFPGDASANVRLVLVVADSDLHGHAGRLGILRHRKVNRDLDPIP